MWYSHKINGPRFHYKISLYIQTGWIGQVNGSYLYGNWFDKIIARYILENLLEPDEKYLANSRCHNVSSNIESLVGCYAFSDY